MPAFGHPAAWFSAARFCDTSSRRSGAETLRLDDGDGLVRGDAHGRVVGLDHRRGNGGCRCGGGCCGRCRRGCRSRCDLGGGRRGRDRGCRRGGAAATVAGGSAVCANVAGTVAAYGAGASGAGDPGDAAATLTPTPVTTARPVTSPATGNTSLRRSNSLCSERASRGVQPSSSTMRASTCSGVLAERGRTARRGRRRAARSVRPAST